MHAIVDWIVETVGRFGYSGIFLLMMIESSFFPFPSEVVMIPAGYLAFQGEMGLWQVICLGIAGSIAGALINYYLAISLGRPLILRYGKYVFLGPETLDKVDRFFEKHGEIATFNGRLVPGIRQLISLPAGLARMNIGRFVFYTSLGAGIWVTILTLLGFVLGAQEELIRSRLSEITIIAIIFVAVSTIAYYFWQRQRRN